MVLLTSFSLNRWARRAECTCSPLAKRMRFNFPEAFFAACEMAHYKRARHNDQGLLRFCM